MDKAGRVQAPTGFRDSSCFGQDQSNRVVIVRLRSAPSIPTPGAQRIAWTAAHVAVVRLPDLANRGLGVLLRVASAAVAASVRAAIAHRLLTLWHDLLLPERAMLQ